MQRTATHRRARRFAVVAVLVALSVVLAACSATTKQAAGSADSTPLPGITAKTVKVGFQIVDLGKLSAELGFKDADYGGVAGQTKDINALVNWVNQNGGMGGRQVIPDIKVYEASTDSPEQTQTQCAQFTQDDQVFGIVMDGLLQTDGLPCYQAAHTLVMDETLVAHDQTEFQQYSPYLWSPTHPEYGAFLKAQLVSMNQAGFFKGNTGVLLVPGSDEVSRRVTTSIAEPYLQSIGVTKYQVSYVDSTNTGTLGQTSDAAMIAGKSANLNRVIVIGGSRIEPVVLESQKAVGYDSQWSVSSYDEPYFNQQNLNLEVETLFPGMTGLGYSPSLDLGSAADPPVPDPTNPAQVKCVQIMTAAGGVPPGNLLLNWKEPLEYCDGVMFLMDTLNHLPGTATVTGSQFVNAVGQIGGTYRSSLTFGSQWGPGTFAGTDEARPLAWDATTQNFAYTGPPITFSTTGVSGTTPASGAATPSTGSTAGTSGGTTSGTTGGSGSVPLQTITEPAP